MEAAKAAKSVAMMTDQRTRGGSSQSAIVYGFPVAALLKKALKAALKYYGHKIPKPIRPYAGKILDVLEQTEVWEEAGLTAAFLTAAFMAVGIPPDVAHQAAHWIVVFLG